MCVGKSIVYIVFSTICGFGHLQGVLEHILCGFGRATVLVELNERSLNAFYILDPTVGPLVLKLPL